MAYLHWCECRATNDWPRGGDGQIDAVVRRNASIISAVQSLAERRMSNAELALSLMGGGGKRG